MTDPAGLLLIDKARGPSSAEVVRVLSRKIGKRHKIGHAGTLDPDGEGLLVILIGDATKLSETIMDLPKIYDATFRFGVATDTYDATGIVTEEHDVAGLTVGAIESALPEFTGAIQQVPPPYSAVKIKGRRAYELARKGEKTDLAARPAHVYELKVLSFENPDAHIHVSCGKGMYLRSLAHDIGRKLGVGAHVSRLRRTAVGALTPQHLLDAVTEENWRELLIDGAAIYAGQPAFVLSSRGALNLCRGLPIKATDFVTRPTDPVGRRTGVLDETGRLIAVATIGHGGALLDRRIIRSL